MLNNAALCFKIGQQLFKNISILMWKSFSLACLPESCSFILFSFFLLLSIFFSNSILFFSVLAHFLGWYLVRFLLFSLLWRIVNALVVRVKTDLELYIRTIRGEGCFRDLHCLTLVYYLDTLRIKYTFLGRCIKEV